MRERNGTLGAPWPSVDDDRGLCEFMSDIDLGAVVLDRSARVVFVNDRMLDLLERSRDDMLGREWMDVVPDSDRQGLRTLFAEVMATATPRGGQENRIVTPSGTERLLAWTCVVQVDHGGNATGVACLAHDVTSLRMVEADLMLEAAVRHRLGEACQHLAVTVTLEEAAHRVCDRISHLPCVDAARVLALVGPDDAAVVAGWGLDALLRVGQPVSVEIARQLWTRAAEGCWGSRQDRPDLDDPLGLTARAAGVKALAVGVIGRDERPAGVLLVATADPDAVRTVAVKLPPLIGFGARANAVLVDRLMARRRDHQMRAALREVIDAGAFHPHFQPIVELSSGEAVGYEALTRFASGEPPNVRFAQAWAVGMGADLELEALRAAIAGAGALPAGRWLDLNISPRLLDSAVRLADALRRADRPVVIEITEHERIADYAAVRAAASALGAEVRLAVDDAGVGIANFSHIIELRPDFVKLDASLVRRVNADLGRQALVVAMCQFARSAGCHIIAEGVESQEEASTLRQLGVEFAQGYWFGRPGAADRWS